MHTPTTNKQLLSQLLYRLSESDGSDIDKTLADFCDPDAVWRVFHPFNDLNGIAEAGAKF
jgi:hypothetical protein